MSTKRELELAYEAGRQALNEPAERRTVDACPFEPGSEEAREWLRGFSDALEATPPVANLRKQIDDAMKAGDDVA